MKTQDNPFRDNLPPPLHNHEVLRTLLAIAVQRAGGALEFSQAEVDKISVADLALVDTMDPVRETLTLTLTPMTEALAKGHRP